jgi:hypothetical protein
VLLPNPKMSEHLKILHCICISLTWLEDNVRACGQWGCVIEDGMLTHTYCLLSLVSSWAHFTEPRRSLLWYSRYQSFLALQRGTLILGECTLLSKLVCASAFEKPLWWSWIHEEQMETWLSTTVKHWTI